MKTQSGKKMNIVSTTFINKEEEMKNKGIYFKRRNSHNIKKKLYMEKNGKKFRGNIQ